MATTEDPDPFTLLHILDDMFYGRRTRDSFPTMADVTRFLAALDANGLAIVPKSAPPLTCGRVWSTNRDVRCLLPIDHRLPHRTVDNGAEVRWYGEDE